MRRLLTLLCLAFLTVSVAGCATSERSTVFSLGYVKRHLSKFADDLHQFRVDVDRTIFDLDDRPIEEN